MAAVIKKQRISYSSLGSLKNLNIIVVYSLNGQYARSDDEIILFLCDTFRLYITHHHHHYSIKYNIVRTCLSLLRDELKGV